jgi:hypothetical protein
VDLGWLLPEHMTDESAIVSGVDRAYPDRVTATYARWAVNHRELKRPDLTLVATSAALPGHISVQIGGPSPSMTCPNIISFKSGRKSFENPFSPNVLTALSIARQAGRIHEHDRKIVEQIARGVPSLQQKTWLRWHHRMSTYSDQTRDQYMPGAPLRKARHRRSTAAGARPA